MPASQDVRITKGVTASAVPTDPPDPVFWTDDCPTFKVTVSVSEEASKPISEDSKLRFHTHIDDYTPIRETVTVGPISLGSEESYEIEGKPLTYEGHAVCEIAGKRSVSGSTKEETKLVRSTNSSPAYSFSVWDESHYESTVRRPKHLQYALIATSVVLIGFAILQIIVVVAVQLYPLL